MRSRTLLTALAVTGGLLAGATPATAALPVDVGAITIKRLSSTSVLATAPVTTHSPSTTVYRAMHTRGSKTLSNVTGRSIRRTLTGVKVGDYVTATARDAHGHVDRSAIRISAAMLRG